MLGDLDPAVPTEAGAAWERYCNADPKPSGTQAWFDHHYPDEAHPMLIPSAMGPGLVLDMIRDHPDPVTAERLFDDAPMKFTGPGWRFSDGSGLYLDCDNMSVRHCAGGEHDGLETPDETLESPATLRVLGMWGTPQDIRKAVLGPYRDRLHLLLQAPMRGLREMTIAALGGRRP